MLQRNAPNQPVEYRTGWSPVSASMLKLFPQRRRSVPWGRGPEDFRACSYCSPFFPWIMAMLFWAADRPALPTMNNLFENLLRWVPIHWRWELAVAGTTALIAMLWIEIIRRRNRQQTLLLREWARREAELKERYHELFENANDIVFTVDLAGNLTSINKAAESVTGFNRSEALGGSIYEFIVPEHRERARTMLTQKVADRVPTTYCVDVIKKNGGRVSLEINSRLIYENGAPAGVQGVARNITERKLGEEALKQSEAQVRLLLESAAEGIFGLDKNGNCTFCNSACVRLLGHTDAHALLGKNIYSLIHPTNVDGTTLPLEDRPIFRANLAGVELHADTEVFWRADGSSFPVEYWSHPIVRNRQGVGSVVSFMDITERKALESKLALRERRLNSFFAAAPAGLAILDSELRFTQINKTMARINGFSATECAGKTIWELLPRLSSLIEPSLRHVLNSGKPMLNVSIKGETARQPGVTRYWMVSYFPIPALEERTLNVAVIAIEVTDRKRAEEALRKSEHRLNSMLASLKDVVWSIAPDTRQVIYLNPATEQVYGRKVSEFFENPHLWLDAVHPVDRDRVEDCLDDLLTSGTLDQEYRIIRPDGQVRWIHDRAQCFRDIQGAAVRLNGIQTDITERKQAEENLKLYRQIFANTTEAAAILDPQGRYLEQNAAHRNLLGFSDTQLQGADLAVALGAELAATIKNEVERSGSFQGEGAVRNSQGEMASIEAAAMTITSDDGDALCHALLIRDITEQRRVEEERQKAREAAEAANRAKGEFLANMSHEIRTPLNGILGMTELALNTDLTEEQQEYLKMVKASGESLLTVINDILDFSKIEAGRLDLNPIDFDLRDALGDTLKTLALRAHQKNLELTLHVAPETPRRVMADPTRLRQIIVNLIGNSIKFTEQGEIILQVSAESETADELILHFTVRDTGIGIPREKQLMIFEPFTQADSSATRKYSGTGLGLAISLQLVELMGGRLWVESEAGKGSSFHFNMRARVSKEPGKRMMPAAAMQLREMAVLVVDDNVTNRRVLEEMLVAWGMKPAMADGGWTGLAAMEQAKADGKTFPLVLIDAQMPDLDGFSLAERIKQSSGLAGATIMMLTSAGRRGDAARCRALGIAAYLHKPIKESDLLQAVLLALGAKDQEAQTGELITRHTLREQGRSLHILLAEDNLVNRELAERLLKKNGHEVTAVGDGREALDAIEKCGLTAFDAVLMDVQMPRLDGLETTAAIRKKEQETGTHLPIIAMTAHAMKGDRKRFLDAGMDGYLAKPVQAQELFQVLEKTILSSLKISAESVAAAGAENPVDWDHALAQLDGDRELLHDLVCLFAQETPPMLDKLREATNRGEVAVIERTAHTLKGSIGNFGAAQAFERASKLEQIARAGDLPQARQAFLELEAEIQRVLSAMENVRSGVSG